MEPNERWFNEEVAGNPQVSWAFSPLCVLWEAVPGESEKPSVPITYLKVPGTG